MFKVKNEAERATVYLYGTIGSDWWDADSSNTAREFAQTLDSMGGKPLDIRVDSCGGDVYEGFAIASAIQRYEGETTAYVDGIAASAASYIAVMADKVVMASFGQMMIHDAWTIASGNSQELADMAARLDALDATIAGIIAARSGMAVEDVRAAMDAETWYDAQGAVDAGLADEVTETEQRMAASLDRSILARFRNVPEAVKTQVETFNAALVAAGKIPASDDVELAPQPAETTESHAQQTMREDEGRTLILGNRVIQAKE